MRLKLFTVLMVLLLPISLTSYGDERIIGRGASETLPTMSRAKIDASLMVEIEKLKSSQKMDQEIGLLIRTRRENDATERAAIERRGGKIGSVIGDILTVRAPAKAILEISDLEFVIYIEKSKKQRPR